MQRQGTGTPVLSWCLIVRNAERTLEACLQSLRERTPDAEIVVVDTMSSDRSAEIAQKYADVWVEWTGPRGDWTREMPWFDDAAAARQHAFELASGRWRSWIDSVTGETPVVIRRRGSPFMEYVEIRDLISPSQRDRRELCYELSTYEVLTDQGWQPIKAIKQHKVKKPVYRIVDDGDVRVTEDHSLMSGGRPILGRAVDVGTRLDHFEAPVPWGEAAQTLTPTLAEAWGLFAAEGWASDVEDGSGRGLWALYNTNQALLEEARVAFQAAHTRPFRFVQNTKAAENNLACWRLEPQDPRELAILYREAFYSSGGRKKVPREILNGSREIMAAFVRGYERGDGHVRRVAEDGRELQSWSTNSPILAAGLNYLYRCLGRDLRCSPPRPDKPTIVSMVERSGAPSGRSSLSREDLAHAQHRYAAGETVKDIAASMGLSWSALYRHLRGEVKNYQGAALAPSVGKEPQETVRAVVAELDFEGWVYDLHTEAGTFVGGVGDFVLHNSDDRLPGPEEAEKLLKINNQWKPQVGHGKVVNGHDGPVGLTDLLLEIEGKPEMAEVTCIWAPYLYRKDEHGHALTWQVRERIVRWDNPPRFRWLEASHEVLVPVPGYTPPRAEFSHLLFVHEKEFSDEDFQYAVARHFDVLHKQYVQGGAGRTTRRCLYLAEYAKMLCPAREMEFLDAAHQEAVTALDRYRVLLQKGIFHAARGLHHDAEEAFGAATFLRGDLPDAWLCGGLWWRESGNHVKAMDWFQRALALKPNPIESYVAPRDLAVKYPTMLVEAYHEVARLQIRAGAHAQAQQILDAATQVMLGVRDCEAIGADHTEAHIRVLQIDNAAKAQAQAIALHKLATYLLDNDESQKAAELLRAVPWNLQDHPLVVELEKTLAPTIRHLTDEKAYFDFYHSTVATGAVESPPEWMDLDKCCPRARWIGAWINEHAPQATVVDVGCFDGIIGIPVLKLCPGIKYIGAEPYSPAANTLRARIKECGFEDRAEVRQGDDYAKLIPPGTATVLLWTEVIEHVQDPVRELAKLAPLLAPGGHLLVTTPWGAYDHGHPPKTTQHGDPRGHRGHVRAMTPRDVVEVFEQAKPGWTVEQLWRATSFKERYLSGDELGAIARKMPAPARRVAFSVPTALWDWNSRRVHAEGMGASEETIVYLAQGLAKDAAATVEVFGPTPHEAPYTEAEVHDKVRYWPREQLRHLQRTRPEKIVVSRSPSHGANDLTKLLGEDCPPKILWLQDAYYPDLNAMTAEAYEKIVVVSEWHMDLMHHMHGVPLDKMVVRYNFLLPEHFSGAAIDACWALKKKDHFIYASSPDRGLIELLRAWPRIRERLPEATLSIFYGWKGCTRLGGMQDPNWTQRFQVIRREYEKLQFQPGVIDAGLANHARLAMEYAKAGVWAYPTNFDETGCLSACKARAGGAVPVCPPRAALAETANCKQGFFVPENDEDSFVDACVEATKVGDADRRAMSKEAIETYGLPALLPGWKTLLLP